MFNESSLCIVELELYDTDSKKSEENDRIKENLKNLNVYDKNNNDKTENKLYKNDFDKNSNNPNNIDI